MTKFVSDCEATPHGSVVFVHPYDQPIALADQHPGHIGLQLLGYHDGAKPLRDGVGLDRSLVNAELPKKSLRRFIGPSHGRSFDVCYALWSAQWRLPARTGPVAGCAADQLGFCTRQRQVPEPASR